MKVVLSFLGAVLLLNFGLIAQNETYNWVVSPNSIINFSTGSPVLTAGVTSAIFYESNATVSDENGNLLFYSDGDTVKGINNIALVNGENISSKPGVFQLSNTQGALFIKKPKSDSIYYLFSLASSNGSFNSKGVLSYSIINTNLNGGLGAVVSKKNLLLEDTLSEKMTATKHCNNIDYWLVIVKYKILNYIGDAVNDYEIEFQSFLVTKNGVQNSPIKSSITTKCPLLGQMKFNNKGDEIAFAENNYLSRFSFDNSTGKVQLKTVHFLPLENGYGIEYSPNDSLIYINEKQFHPYSNTLTQLQNYSMPAQLQRANDGKIYFYSIPQSEIMPSVGGAGAIPNNYIFAPNSDMISNIGVIDSPNNLGVNCLYTPIILSINHPNNYQTYVALPNFPSYYFKNNISDFTYSGTCNGEAFQFTLVNSVNADSIVWYFNDTGSEVTSDTANYIFSTSGEWQVTVEVYLNGIVYQGTQCVSVCGANSVNLPSVIDLCKTEPHFVNALNTCAVSYLWNTGDTTSTIYINEVGSYILTTTNECGVFYDTIEVFKSDDCNVIYEIPNVITANGDQINDIFSIKVKNAKKINYSIVNRWGNLINLGEISVVSSQVFDLNTFNLWDGTARSGDLVVDGTYFYVIEFTTIDERIIKTNGFVQVVH